eukprot:TRINITY_DN22900_c0_g1_i1.p1 TRINITY_DN22900_c0_g1~~TRINITY_DN22900_c0_g1_i1.p1  ORF type:complete len:221 (+),score=78.21 TRINITY_DN22900_c0_g1_i1:58-663(+)
MSAVESAAQFLQDPKVVKRSAKEKVDFLRGKGVSDEDICSAAKDAGDIAVYEIVKEKIEVVVPERVFSLAELKTLRGEKGAMLCLSCKGIVYEVDPEFYGTGMAYHVFSGVDCSRHLAKVRVGDNEANQHWTGLTPTQQTTLADWEEKYQKKYKILGRIDVAELTEPKTTAEAELEEEERQKKSAAAARSNSSGGGGCATQ